MGATRLQCTRYSASLGSDASPLQRLCSPLHPPCPYRRVRRRASSSHACHAIDKDSRSTGTGHSVTDEAPNEKPGHSRTDEAGNGNPTTLPKQANPDGSPPTSQVWQKGYLQLLAVSFLWGSYTPSVRYMYLLDAGVSPQVITAYRAVLSALVLLATTGVIAAVKQAQQHGGARPSPKEGASSLQSQPTNGATPSPISSPSITNLAGQLQQQQQQQEGSEQQQQQGPPSPQPQQGGHQVASAGSIAVLLAGFELGLYNFAGTAAQALGLELTSASRASFLTQTTAVLTPCFAWAFRQTVLPNHWLACSVALLGSCMITLDSLLDPTPPPPPPSPPPRPALQALPQGQVTAVASASGVTAAAAPALTGTAPDGSGPVQAAVAVGSGAGIEESSRAMLGASSSSSTSDRGCYHDEAYATAAEGRSMDRGSGNSHRSSEGSGSSSSFSALPVLSSSLQGEVYVLVSCCCYALATVRLSLLASQHDAVQLATAKGVVLALASLTWLLLPALGVSDSGGGPGSSMMQQLAAAVRLPLALSGGLGLAVLLFSAWGPGALSAVLATSGQSQVGAAQAQVIYSLTPIWTALLVAVCGLPGEELGPLAWLGGLIILSATLLLSLDGSGGDGSNGSSGICKGRRNTLMPAVLAGSVPDTKEDVQATRREDVQARRKEDVS